MKKLSLTIGISALNEERNISRILTQIIDQDTVNFTLKEIIVISDGSVDNTVINAKVVNDKRIKIYDYEDRLGKSERFNQIYRLAKSDITVMLDADCTLGNNKTLDNLIQPFLLKESVMLVGGNPVARKGKTFIQKAIYASHVPYYKARKRLNGGNNIFGCSGPCIALRKEFALKIRLPHLTNEDDYLYLKCISSGYKFINAPKAIVYSNLPTTLKDYIRQYIRSNPVAVQNIYKKEFGDLVSSEYHIPMGFLMKSYLAGFISNPIGFILIATIRILLTPFLPVLATNYKLDWYIAKSTK